MTWHTEYRCVHCSKPMTYNTRMDSHGRCPFCGVKKSQGTIVDTTEHAYREVRCGKWWQFWKYKREYKDDLD